MQRGGLVYAERGAAEVAQLDLLAELRHAADREVGDDARGEAGGAAHHLAVQDAEVSGEVEVALDARAGLHLVELDERGVRRGRDLVEVDAELGTEVESDARLEGEIALQEARGRDLDRPEVDVGQAEIGSVETAAVIEDLAQVQLDPDRGPERRGVETAGERERGAVVGREEGIGGNLRQHAARVGEAAEGGRDLGQAVEERSLQLRRVEVLHSREVEALQQRAGEARAGEVRAGELEALEVQAAEVEARQVEPREVGEAQIDPRQRLVERGGEIDAAQVGAEELGRAGRIEMGRAFQLHPGQVEPAERDAVQIQPREVEAAQAQARQVSARGEAGDQARQVLRAGGDRAGEIGAHREDAHQVGARKVRALQDRVAQVGR